MVACKSNDNFTGDAALGMWTIAAIDNQIAVTTRRCDENSVVSPIHYYGEGKTDVVLQTRTCKGGCSPA